jgi:ABC-type branched-subunit amino acid transport system permease subunit
VPAAELLCVALGAFIPVLLGYTVLRSVGRRAIFAAAAVATGVAVTALSAALSWGPSHAWAWLILPVRLGLLFGLLLSMLMLAVPRRGCAAVLLLVLVVHLSVLNQAPTSAYFADTLQAWEQGRFIRFHGLAQWLGWVWPYSVLVYVLVRLSRREAAPTIPA